MARATDPELDLAAIEAELRERRARTAARVDGLAAPAEPGSGLGFGKRIGDGTIEAVSRLTEIGVGSSLEAGLEQTDRALEKLAEGSYGRCEVCGEEIPAGRLRARPDSVLCLEHAAAQRRLPPRRR